MPAENIDSGQRLHTSENDRDIPGRRVRTFFKATPRNSEKELRGVALKFNNILYYLGGDHHSRDRWREG